MAHVAWLTNGTRIAETFVKCSVNSGPWCDDVASRLLRASAASLVMQATR